MDEKQMAMLEYFGQPELLNSFDLVVPDRLRAMSSFELLDTVDWVLASPDVFMKFTPWQIGQALDGLYSPMIDDFAHAYIDKALPAIRQVEAVKNLRLLYDNYFEKLCSPKMSRVGGAGIGPINDLCYMFWDISVICPPNLVEEATKSAIDVMRHALNCQNDSCICSALHGLGHWQGERPEITGIILEWLEKREDLPDFLREYALQASEGCVQ